MTADTIGKRPFGRFEEHNIHSKYQLVARRVPQSVAEDIVSGRTLVANLVHGYQKDVIGYWRFTQVTTPDNSVAYEMREPGQGIILGSENPPFGVSADVEYKERIGQDAYDKAWGKTMGYRVGKDRHVVVYEAEEGVPAYPAQIDIFRAGVAGEVAGVEELDGHAIVVVHFTSIDQAKAFNKPGVRPKWMGDIVTKPFSTKKLVLQLNGDDSKSLAPYWLEKSGSFGDLEKRAQLA